MDSLKTIEMTITRLERLAPLNTTLNSPPPPPLTKHLTNHNLELNTVTTTLINAINTHTTNKPIRLLLSTPPRHGKTITLLHALAWLLRIDPTKTHAYVTYGQHLANSKSRIARAIARNNHVTLSTDSTSVHEWRTTSGGGLLATGIGGPLTGQGITGLGIIDDPIKNRVEAESRTKRETIIDWFRSTFYTRLEPGSSCIIISTRWHPEDLIGVLKRDPEWTHVNLPAINDAGEPLWPTKYNLETLNNIRTQVGEYEWAAMYQGHPTPRGGNIFRDVTYYDELPNAPYREAHGFDAAYTSNTKADYSVTLTGRLINNQIYVTNMIRAQLEPRRYASILTANNINHVWWIRSGTEKGLEALLTELGVKVTSINASTDKFVRAQHAAALWNANKILIPKNADWAPTLTNEILDFTGTNDKHDDIIDALAALTTALIGTRRPNAQKLNHALGWG